MGILNTWSIISFYLVTTIMNPREGPGNPFQYSCLEKVIDREALRAIGHKVAESSMAEVT